ncbi:MAG: asparagine synthase (glutamine-hydrolyzing) [Deltaproteobacteria bacterium]|nr:asparagine synthase (glutamine-hydrolyzing) [Deltaproteobacteria bacterium]
MCGICGVFLSSSASRFGSPSGSHSGSPSSNANLASRLVAQVRQMNEHLVHRGPDEGGILSRPQHGLCLGHRRLSIVALGEEGQQPLSSYTRTSSSSTTSAATQSAKQLHLSFNGEVYNFTSLQTQLRKEGVSLDSTSDTRVLAEWLAHHPHLSALETLRGMFAFAALDEVTEELHLVRDPMGQKPLYFASLFGEGLDGCLVENDWVPFAGDLAFASEPKAMFASEGFDDVVDGEVLDHTLRFGVGRGLNRADEGRTLYQHLWQVPPGARIRFRRRGGALEAKLERYFDVLKEAQYAQQNPYLLSFDAAVDDVEHAMRQAVQRRLMADVPLGAFLSGGIDSSLVVAFMREMREQVQTFTIGFESTSWVASDESDDAARIARHLGTEHHRLLVTGQDALDVVPKLAQMYDFPFADASAIPTFLVSAFARDKVKVSLTGDGADELFGGYARYGWTRSMLRGLAPLSSNKRTHLQSLTTLSASLLEHAAFENIRRMLPAGLARRATADTANKVAALLGLEGADDVYRAFLTQWEQIPLVEGVEPTSSSLRLPPGKDLEKRLMLLDLHAYLPDDILQKVDRASMAVSLEARAPFLDVDVVRLALSLPTSHLLSKRQNKKVLRKLLSRHLPDDAIDPGKRGFGVPLDHWLRHELRDWAEDLLQPDELEANGLIPDPILRRWREHLSGERSFHYSLWNILMVQDFLRQRRSLRA